MVDEHAIRPATRGDRDAILAIVGEMWGCEVASRYEWLYQRNPHGPALTWVAQETSGQRSVVGVTSLFPRRFSVAGQERRGALGGDCYVLPRARRKGLATRLHQATFASMRSQGNVGFMVGPPRPNNLAALLKAGSNETTVFRRWTRPLTGDAFVRMVTRRPPAPAPAASCSLLAPVASLADGAMSWLARAHRDDRTTLLPMAAFPRRTSTLLDAITASHGDGIVPIRDPEWMAWRYFSGPTRAQRVYAVCVSGDIVGFIVLEVQGGRAILVDVALPATAGLLDAGLDAAVDEARALGGELLDANFTPGAPVVARLGLRGFVGREARGFQVAFAAGYDPAARGDLLRPAWTFSDGDKDRDTSFLTTPVT